jgi:hypothetical protein
MSLGRGLLTGTGWAGPLGMAALCALVLLFALVAFSGGRRDDGVPALRERRAPAVQLARPPDRPRR